MTKQDLISSIGISPFLLNEMEELFSRLFLIKPELPASIHIDDCIVRRNFNGMMIFVIWYEGMFVYTLEMK